MAAVVDVRERAFLASLENSDNALLNLPNEMLTEIFKHSITIAGDVKRLPLVSQRFKGFSGDDNIFWKILAQKYGKKVEDHSTWRESYYLYIEDKFIDPIDDFYKVLARIKFAQSFPTENNIQIAKDSIDVILNHPDLFYLKAKAFIKLAKTFPADENIKKTSEFRDKILNFSDKVKIQIKFTKAFPTEENIKRSIMFLSKLPDSSAREKGFRSKTLKEIVNILLHNNKITKASNLIDEFLIPKSNRFVEFFKSIFKLSKLEEGIALAQIKLAKDYPTDENIKKASRFIDRMPDSDCDSYAKANAQIRFAKAFPSFNNLEKARKFIDRMPDSFGCVKAAALIKFAKAFPTKKNIKKTYEFIDRMPDSEIYEKAKALIKFAKVFPTKKNINKAMESINKIPDSYHETKALTKFSKAFPTSERIIKIRELLPAIPPAGCSYLKDDKVRLKLAKILL